MRAFALAHTAFIILTLALLGPAIAADEHDPNVKGLYLMTDYPAVTVRPGTTSNIPLRLQNYGLAPDRYQLSVTGVPKRLDRNAARRRAAGCGCDAGAGRQRVAAASPRRAGQGRHERADHDGQGGRAGQPGQPADRRSRSPRNCRRSSR